MDDQLSFRPIHAAHAIEVVSAHMRMAAPVGAIAWGHALEAAYGIAERLGLAVVEPDVPADDDDENIAAMLESAERTFEMRDEEGGLVDVLRLTRREIIFSTHRYTRWARFSERAVPALGGLARVYCAAAAPLGFRVSYLDRFVGDGADAVVSDVLDRSSHYLPAFVFEVGAPWKTEGTFAEGEVDGHYRVCEHVVRYLDEAPGQKGASLSIHTVATDLRSGGAAEPSAVTCDETMVAPRLEGLHDALKRYLGRIITSDMARRISLSPAA